MSSLGFAPSLRRIRNSARNKSSQVDFCYKIYIITLIPYVYKECAWIFFFPNYTFVYVYFFETPNSLSCIGLNKNSCY